MFELNNFLYKSIKKTIKFRKNNDNKESISTLNEDIMQIYSSFIKKLDIIFEYTILYLIIHMCDSMNIM